MYRKGDTVVHPEHGAAVIEWRKPWGEVFDLDMIRDTIKRVRPKVLGIVHAETSTGAQQPVEQLGKLCHDLDTLLITDTVTNAVGVREPRSFEAAK